ncbi:MAG: class I SAM-dependent methyltransferase [Acidimicrobiales bacterium]
MDPSAIRWKKLVEGRLGEMERLQEGRGVLGGQFWDKRARRFSKGPMASADSDPMASRLRQAVGGDRAPTRSVLDVGSGPGRFSLLIAPRATAVTAVDPSRRMLEILRKRAREQGISNVRTVHGKWQEVDVEPADVVLCSHVVTLVADAAPFIRKLHAAARQKVLLYVGAYAIDAVLDPFWRHFHNNPRKPGPTYVDALRVVEELGLRPAVEVVEVRARSRHDSLADAVEVYRDTLVLPKTAEVRKELTRLLDPWLQRRDGGLYAPFRTQPAAIISWPGGAPPAAP